MESATCFRSMSTAMEISLEPRPYTELSTQTVSTSTNCETQAPLAVSCSAAASWLASSRATRRTSTLVSTARMFSFQVLANALAHLDEGLGSWRRGKDRPVDVLGGVPASLADDRLVAFQGPLQH